MFARSPDSSELSSGYCAECLSRERCRVICHIRRQEWESLKIGRLSEIAGSLPEGARGTGYCCHGIHFEKLLSGYRPVYGFRDDDLAEVFAKPRGTCLPRRADSMALDVRFECVQTTCSQVRGRQLRLASGRNPAERATLASQQADCIWQWAPPVRCAEQGSASTSSWPAQGEFVDD
jgi:hypothetical protein